MKNGNVQGQSCQHGQPTSYGPNWKSMTDDTEQRATHKHRAQQCRASKTCREKKDAEQANTMGRREGII